jgi:hypothetical protein
VRKEVSSLNQEILCLASTNILLQQGCRTDFLCLDVHALCGGNVR